MILALFACMLLQAAEPRPAQGLLQQTIEKIELREAGLRDALHLISEETGANLVASEEAEAKTVSLFLQNATLQQVIEALAKSYGLWYREDERTGVIRVMTAKEFQRDLVLFRDEKTQVFTLLYPHALDIGLAIKNLFGSRVRMALDQQQMFDEYMEMQQRFQRFDLLQQRAQGLSKGANGGSTFGAGGANGGFNSFNSGGFGLNALNGGFGLGTSQQTAYDAQQNKHEPKTLTPEQLAAHPELAAESRTSDGDTLDRLTGEQPSIYVSVVRRNNRLAVRTSDQAAMKQIEELVKALDVATPQVLLEVKVFGIDLGDDFNSVLGARFTSGNNTVTQSGDTLNTSFPDPRNLVYQFVNNDLLARLQLLQERKRLTTLATPMLLVANNEVARVFIGEERPVVRNIVTTSNQNQSTTVTNSSAQTELVQVGTALLLTPNINADRTVTLRVVQENAQVKKNDALIPVVVGSQVVSQPVDVVQSRSVAGTIVAKDGLALALGGLIEESISNQQAGVPLLMDIPLLGALFRRETKSRSRTELVVFVRPYILLTAPEGTEVSQKLNERLMAHPFAGGDFPDAMGAFKKDEAPRPDLASDPLKEILKFQSGLPGGEVPPKKKE